MTTASADVPMKGLAYLVEALAKLRTEQPDAHLVVVGEPRPASPAAQTLERLGLEGAVTFRPGVSDAELVELYAQASAVAVPSLYEGFSLPAVEAMACEVPVVASSGGALPEVVGPDGERLCSCPRPTLVPWPTPWAWCYPDPTRPGEKTGARRPGTGAGPLHLGTLRRRRRRAVPVRACRPSRETPAAVLTVRYDRLGLRPGERLLDFGCGGGRHALEAMRQGAVVDGSRCRPQGARAGGRLGDGHARRGQTDGGLGGEGHVVAGDGLALPFPDGRFDKVDRRRGARARPRRRRCPGRARPGPAPRRCHGRHGAPLVPRTGVLGAVDEYHNVPGGHIRIYRRGQLAPAARPTPASTPTAATTPTPSTALLVAALRGRRRATTHNPLVQAYHRLLVWDITSGTPLTRVPEAVLNPVLGKCLVVYLGSRAW